MWRLCSCLVSLVVGLALVSQATPQDQPKYYRLVSENSGSRTAT